MLRIVQQHVDPHAVIEQGPELVGAAQTGGFLVGPRGSPTWTTRPSVAATAARISGTQSTPSTLV